MTGELDTRLLRLKTELDDHARIARYLGLDFERPIQSLGDGYPENAIAWVGEDHLMAAQAAVAASRRAGHFGRENTQGPDQRVPAVHPQSYGDRGAARHPAAA